MKAKTDKRLDKVASLIDGRVLADIGTDHGKLPVELILSGKIDKAFASDINEGPLSQAAALIEENSLSEKIKTVLADGISGIDLKEVSDISICGMGGELISSILENSFSKEYSRINFILNPMTRDDELRRYLSGRGFFIEKEVSAIQSGRVYTVIKAKYKGTPYEKEEFWYYIGEREESPEDKRYIEKVISRLEKQKRNPETKAKIEKIISDIKEKILWI